MDTAIWPGADPKKSEFFEGLGAHSHPICGKSRRFIIRYLYCL